MIEALNAHLPAMPWLAPKELAALRRKLIEERDRRLAEYERDMTAAQSIQEEGMEDLEELATMDVDRDRLFAYSEQDRETLRLIEEALQRMDEGTYGLCVSCGAPIPLNRLRAIPWARYGTDMQARIETGEVSESAAGN
jgi:DnaK suppressor protein